MDDPVDEDAWEFMTVDVSALLDTALVVDVDMVSVVTVVGGAVVEVAKGIFEEFDVPGFGEHVSLFIASSRIFFSTALILTASFIAKNALTD